MERIAAFIVDKRKAFYLMYIGAAIFCVFSSGWVAVVLQLSLAEGRFTEDVAPCYSQRPNFAPGTEWLEGHLYLGHFPDRF